MPIYSGLNESPKYKSEIEGLNIDEFNKNFGILYEKNSKKGYKIIEKKFNRMEGAFTEKMKEIMRYIKKEILDLSKHK